MKKAAALFMAGMMLTASAVPALAGEWKRDNIGWWWQEDDGSYPAGRWQLIGGKWYYFHGSGYMAESQWVDGMYYVDASGAMLANTTTPDGYQVDAEGKVIQPQQTQTGAGIDYSGEYVIELGKTAMGYENYQILTLKREGQDTYHVTLETSRAPMDAQADATGKLLNNKLTFQNAAGNDCAIDFSTWEQGYFTLQKLKGGYEPSVFFR